MDRRTFLASTAAVGSVGLAGCAAGDGGDGTASTTGADGTETYDIGMTTRRFEPARLEIEPGTNVVWKNTSAHAHTVTAYYEDLPEGGAFFSTGDFIDTEDAREGWRNGTGGALYQGETFDHRFEVVGEFPYFCIPHEASGMAGTIVVTEDATTATTDS
jgi:plastocyanin